MILLTGCMKSLSAKAGNSDENLSLPVTIQTVGPSCALPFIKASYTTVYIYIYIYIYMCNINSFKCML